MARRHGSSSSDWKGRSAGDGRHARRCAGECSAGSCPWWRRVHGALLAADHSARSSRLGGQPREDSTASRGKWEAKPAWARGISSEQSSTQLAVSGERECEGSLSWRQGRQPAVRLRLELRAGHPPSSGGARATRLALQSHGLALARTPLLRPPWPLALPRLSPCGARGRRPAPAAGLVLPLPLPSAGGRTAAGGVWPTPRVRNTACRRRAVRGLGSPLQRPARSGAERSHEAPTRSRGEEEAQRVGHWMPGGGLEHVLLRRAHSSRNLVRNPPPVAAAAPLRSCCASLQRDRRIHSLARSTSSASDLLAASRESWSWWNAFYRFPGVLWLPSRLRSCCHHPTSAPSRLDGQGACHARPKRLNSYAGAEGLHSGMWRASFCLLPARLSLTLHSRPRLLLPLCDRQIVSSSALFPLEHTCSLTPICTFPPCSASYASSTPCVQCRSLEQLECLD